MNYQDNKQTGAIAYKQKLDKGKSKVEIEEYCEKFVHHQTEKEKYILISRFDTIVSQKRANQ